VKFLSLLGVVNKFAKRGMAALRDSLKNCRLTIKNKKTSLPFMLELLLKNLKEINSSVLNRLIWREAKKISFDLNYSLILNLSTKLSTILGRLYKLKTIVINVFKAAYLKKTLKQIHKAQKYLKSFEGVALNFHNSDIRSETFFEYFTTLKDITVIKKLRFDLHPSCHSKLILSTTLEELDISVILRRDTEITKEFLKGWASQQNLLTLRIGFLFMDNTTINSFSTILENYQAYKP